MVFLSATEECQRRLGKGQMKEPWKNKELSQLWKKRGLRPYVKDGEKETEEDKTEMMKISNLRTGWMMWCRAILPLLILGILAGLILERINTFLLALVFSSFFISLGLGWQGCSSKKI